MRLANIVTAISDILAGITIALFAVQKDWTQLAIAPVLLLVLATIGLYGGGVVFNDVFDAELDKIERPERPIPSGLISKTSAATFACLLLLLAVVAAGLVQEDFFSLSFYLAVATAVAAVVYDKWGKHHALFGPLNMGLCRGLNLLLGMSIFPGAVSHYWMVSLVPIVYIAAITMISRGEVHGGKKTTLAGAVALYLLVLASILAVALLNGTLFFALGFVLLFSVLIFPPLQKALKEPKGPLIGKAVKAGVIALIAMNASWAAAFGSFYFALLILLLLPLSLWLAKALAVT
ncbi:MAG TPA: UbiA-like protein EboC [Chitinophagaceae bacterium]|nr:UbiA-like protein EboC [Chitinophagaceae bacterium]